MSDLFTPFGTPIPQEGGGPWSAPPTQARGGINLASIIQAMRARNNLGTPQPVAGAPMPAGLVAPPAVAPAPAAPRPVTQPNILPPAPNAQQVLAQATQAAGMPSPAPGAAAAGGDPNAFKQGLANGQAMRTTPADPSDPWSTQTTTPSILAQLFGGGDPQFGGGG